MPYQHTYYTARQIAELLSISSQKAAKLPVEWEKINGTRCCNQLDLYAFTKSQIVNP